jgi:hypothetical protein
MSGDALNKIQSSPFELTVIEDCVLAVRLELLALKPAQFSQLQFHCGNPPPAPEPKTLICMNKPK